MKHLSLLVALLFNSFLFAQSTHSAASAGSGRADFELVASSEDQWTGIAVSGSGEIFANFPRWSDSVKFSVGKLIDGLAQPYPDAKWNAWEPGKDPATHFVCVQALYADTNGSLWVLDPGNPKFAGVIEGAPKLVQIDLSSGEVQRIYPFAEPSISSASYLNDVRVDLKHQVAYLTDSGDGALVILDLESGEARRVLDDHSSTQAEAIEVIVEGTPFTAPVHADGIAFDPESDTLFYQALTGRTMYKVSAAKLRDPELSETELQAAIEVVGQTGVSDGLLADAEGHVYISALEKNAILRTSPTGEVETVLQDERIAWPDSFSHAPDGWIYFTTARIHEGPNPSAPYAIYRFRP